MRNRFFAIAAIATLAIACNPYDDSTLVSRVNGLESKVEANSKAISDLQTALANAKGLTVTVTEVSGGYKVTFSDGSSFTVMNGKDGQNGKDGADGAVGPQGPAGQDGKDGKDGKDGQGSVDFSIEETADSYIFTINGQTYTLGKTMDFALVLDKTSVNPVAGTPVEVPYTITGAAEGDEIHVFIAQAEGYTASVDEEKAVVTVEVPATLPEKGFVIVSAIDNTTGKQSSQYLSFVSGPSGILTVSYDAQPVPCEGGEIELNINTDADFEVVVPEGCNWITVSEVSTKADYKRYIVVAENTNTSSRQATLIVKTFSDSKEVVVSQAAYEAPKPTVDRPAGSILVLLEGTPAADEVLWSDLHAWLADESGAGETNPNADKLNGKTFFFPRGTYQFPKKASATFTGSKCSVTFVGDYPTFVAAPTSSNSKNQRQFFSAKDYCDFTFENIEFIDADAEGNSNGGAFWVGGSSAESMSTVTVKNCSFEKCSASLGACLFAKNAATIVVENCSFKNCSAGQGPVLCGDTSNKGIYVSIKDSQIENCSASSYGGAIDARYYTEFICTGCTFTNCRNSGSDSSKWLGSAISVGSSTSVPTCVIDGCTFTGCTGSEVIAIFKATLAKISNCLFKGNTVSTVGKIGAEYPTGVIGSKYPVWASNLKFDGNTVESGSAMYVRDILFADGISVYSTEEAAMPVINGGSIIFLGNSTVIAPSAAGMIFGGQEATIPCNCILFNTAEGGAAVASGAAEYLGSFNYLGAAAGVTPDASDKVVAAADINGAWDASAAQYTWNGPASSFTKITPADYQGVVEGYADASFYTWLESVDAFASRGNAAQWWPGSYQK